MSTFNFETSFGTLSLEGMPVSNDFDYREFAINNGFIRTIIDSPKNTEKYGGIGFVVFVNYNDSLEFPFYLKRTLEVVFINELPIMYRFC